MADALGVTKGNVSAWENGRHEPGWAKLLKIGHLTGQPLPVPPELQEPIPKEAAELLADFYVLSPEDRTMTLFQVKRLADLTSEKVNSVTAEKSGTMEHTPHKVGTTRHQTAEQEGVEQTGAQQIQGKGVTLDDAVRDAQRLFGVERASRSTRNKERQGGKS